MRLALVLAVVALASSPSRAEAGAGGVSPADPRSPALLGPEVVPMRMVLTPSKGGKAVVYGIVPGKGPSTSKTVAEWFAAAWRGLGSTNNACSTKDLHFDYWPDGGVRNFWCHAISRFAWRGVVALSGEKPFLRGPHKPTGKLALHDPRDFGRYNPAFVRFLVDNTIPAAEDEVLRAETQPLYEQYVRQLARVYFVVHDKLEAKPAWKKQQRDLYMQTMDEKNPDWASYYDKYSDFLGSAESDWGGYDPNLQSASVAFWLRRDVDKTAPLFFEGLTKLLKTYDAGWLAAQQNKQQH